MIFYGKETTIGLLLVSLPAIISIYTFFVRGKRGISIILLMVSAFLLRFLMISLDPYLHEWDERFHALVAKNMVAFPFKPMLFPQHIMPYSYDDWAQTHIWLHKQPLFLWQMALSMKIFGVGILAMRLPSAIMGTMMVYLAYVISRKWISNENVAYVAALLSTFAYYALELTSGSRSLDHNDLSFVFYMTCSVWAFTRYIDSHYSLKWAIWIGIFSGLAILNKWLVGWLIYGGWGLYLLLSEYRHTLKAYIHLGISIVISLLVFLPWQIYIIQRFPVESAITYAYNRKHLTEDIGHPGTVFFHLEFLPTAYHMVLIVFLIIGLLAIFIEKNSNRKLTLAFLAMIITIFSFFSFFVPVRMPSYVFPVSALMLIIMAFGIVKSGSVVFNLLNFHPTLRSYAMCFLCIAAGFFSLQPNRMIKQRNEQNLQRNLKINHARYFKVIDDHLLSGRVLLNCITIGNPWENIEFMFYKNVLAYNWYPSENRLDSLQAAGYRFAAFQFQNAEQRLPKYITQDTAIVLIDGIK